VVDCDEDGPSALMLADGSHLRCDFAIWTTVATPPAVLRDFPFPRSPQGFLQVDRTLRVSEDVPVFAAGDIADFPEPIAKAGVYAVRQGPILWHNLRAVLTGHPLKVYEPQRDFLTLLACGDGTAILDYKGWAIRSRWAWWLKCAIDKAFVRRFQ
jgi:selenide,water dikinase